ncbi:MAG: hypothetical protein PHY08_14525 [Candidatus Cloacimonetes bacterium]|nr:hypothetical protein [Candidatus Cloacimonadota bacterium]
MLCMTLSLHSCQKERDEVIVSNGTQDSIFDSISEALKDVFS